MIRRNFDNIVERLPAWPSCPERRPGVRVVKPPDREMQVGHITAGLDGQGSVAILGSSLM